MASSKFDSFSSNTVPSVGNWCDEQIHDECENTIKTTNNPIIRIVYMILMRRERGRLGLLLLLLVRWLNLLNYIGEHRCSLLLGTWSVIVRKSMWDDDDWRRRNYICIWISHLKLIEYFNLHPNQFFKAICTLNFQFVAVKSISAK